MHAKLSWFICMIYGQAGGKPFVGAADVQSETTWTYCEGLGFPELRENLFHYVDVEGRKANMYIHTL